MSRDITKRLLCGLVLFTMVLVPARLEAALIPAESREYDGKDAPGFRIASLEGDPVELEKLRGRPVLLNFFATWCPPCEDEIGVLKTLHDRYASRGLVIVGAVCDRQMIPEFTPDDEKEQALAFLKRVKLPFPVGQATKELADRYHFHGIPTTVVVGPDGKIARLFLGFHDAAAIEKVVVPLLARPGR